MIPITVATKLVRRRNLINIEMSLILVSLLQLLGFHL